MIITEIHKNSSYLQIYWSFQQRSIYDIDISI